MVTESNHSPGYRYAQLVLNEAIPLVQQKHFLGMGVTETNDKLMHWGHVGNYVFSIWGCFTRHTSHPGYWHSGVNDTNKKRNVCAYDWDEFWSKSNEWLGEWKCALMSRRCKSDEMDEYLINLGVNVEDKEWKSIICSIVMFCMEL